VAAIRAFDSQGMVFDTVQLNRARTKPAAPVR